MKKWPSPGDIGWSVSQTGDTRKIWGKTCMKFVDNVFKERLEIGWGGYIVSIWKNSGGSHCHCHLNCIENTNVGLPPMHNKNSMATSWCRKFKVYAWFSKNYKGLSTHHLLLGGVDLEKM